MKFDSQKVKVEDVDLVRCCKAGSGFRGCWCSWCKL